MGGSKPLENQLQLKAAPLGEGGVSLKLTNGQYRSGTESPGKFPTQSIIFPAEPKGTTFFSCLFLAVIV